MANMDTYGQAKVACEQHVLAGFGADRSLIARVGPIGGPGDNFDCTGYWPLRFRRPAAGDGSVLVPDVPGLATCNVVALTATVATSGSARIVICVPI